MHHKRKWFKIILRIATVLFAIVFLVVSIFIYRFTKLKTDASIYKKFEGEIHKINISRIQYKDHLVRVFSMQKAIDTSLPILIFVHGSPGSGMDFKRYLVDSELNANSNLITYDRVGYSTNKTEEVLSGLEQELEVLRQVFPVKDMEKVILIGYSYGGTIVATTPEKFRSKILLAPAIKGEFEPRFWLMNLFHWKITKSFMPRVFNNAAKEKMYHLTEFPTYKDKWANSPTQIKSIHGDKDRIVPYKNSLYLRSKFEKDQFKLITIPDGNHGLLWNQFDLIKREIIKDINE